MSTKLRCRINDDGTLAKYEKGTFIYRLAGRNRESSASYYTPEVLTQCLVKYALKELLIDKTADEILELTVCEPAMGSAAFLNEAVNQLAKAYLDRKQKELDQTISHEDYPRELQKVKTYIADRNVHGVDLNPVAVELAEVSLWLNTIYEGGFVPWFGMQIVCGNSLIGARRQVFKSSLLKKVRHTDSIWLDEVPKRVMPGEKRPDKTVYHFLLPARGMADYRDKVVKSMAGDKIKAINEWRREFTKPFSNSEIDQIEKLSDAVDKLLQKHIEMQWQIDGRTTDPLRIFGQQAPEDNKQPTSIEFKDRVLHQEMFSKGVRNSSPYRRLKLAMDYWCALWFWPIEKADLLPGRAEFLFDLTLILEGNLYDGQEKGQMALFPDTRPKQLSLSLLDELGYVNVDKLCEEHQRLCLIGELSETYRFLHWELQFADLFQRRGGFDLVLGNPPWIKVEWNEGGVLGDAEPLFVLRDLSASALAEKRDEALKKYDLTAAYLSAFEEAEATQNFLNGLQNYPLLKGMQTNLYKCFIPQAWTVSRQDSGVSGFLHPEGIYDDPNGGDFRKAVYSRLRYHFQFVNVKKLFSEILHWVTYSINIYASQKHQVQFYTLANVFLPKTVDDSFENIRNKPVAGIKDDRDQWNVEGHQDRIIPVNIDQLELFAQLYDQKGTPPLAARLPALHSTQILEVLRKFADQPRRLGDLKGEYYSTEMWHETNAQKDHTIKRNTIFPKDASQWILSGPHFYVGNPFYKTPNRTCRKHHEYSILDLTSLPDDYLPRTNYVPDCDWAEYRRRTPVFKGAGDRVQGAGMPVTDFFRLVCRGMLSQSGERTLIATICPKDLGHIHTIVSISISDLIKLSNINGLFNSLCFDFFLKSTGRPHLYATVLEQFPFIEDTHIILKSLVLSCITVHYEELWQECFQEDFKTDTWAKSDPRLPNSFFAELTPHWQRNCALRTDYARRQALVEIDVLAAMALGLILDELKTIYRVQFPVLRQNENDTWYDRNGRIVFTCSKGLTGVGFSRPEWDEIKDMKSGTVERTIIDDTLPGGPIERTISYEAPFDKCDREKDYQVAWKEFERRLN